ncbi:hypothetical protein B0H13DRAFT_2349428 [Mycena leptocephala]|nr:hypothetical protein B0H13DRAFT_2349428 [Mycena leptocephala]
MSVVDDVPRPPRIWNHELRTTRMVLAYKVGIIMVRLCQHWRDYNISNIQGFSVAQQIIPNSGAVVTCTSATCPCDQAYRPGDTSGTCGGTGPVDQATRVGASGGYTVV